MEFRNRSGGMIRGKGLFWEDRGAEVETAGPNQSRESPGESDSCFRHLLERFPEPVLVHSEGEVVYANAGGARLCGASTPEQLIGKPILDILRPHHERTAEGRLQRVDEYDEHSYHAQQQLTRLDGRTIDVEVSSALADYMGRAAIQLALRDITERKQAEEALKKQTCVLTERVKELTCLSAISDVIQPRDAQVDTILKEAIQLIPAGWQYPEITCARITVDGQQWQTEGFAVTRWRQTADIVVDEKPVGMLEVCYLENRPRSDEGPFLKQERVLINAIADQMAGAIEPRRMDEQTQQSEKRHRLMAENSTDVILCTDMNARPTYMSPSMTHLLGYSVEEAMTRTMEESLTPTSRATALEDLATEMALDYHAPKDQFRSRTRELEFLRKDGSTVQAEVQVSFLRDEDGTPVEILSILRDITERKRAEEAIKESEERYRNLVESAMDIIVVVSSEGKFISANPAFEAVTGWSVSEWLDRDFSSILHPDDLAMVAELFRATVDREIDNQRFEARAMCKSGEYRTVAIAGRPRFRDGQIVDFYAIAHDVTERKQAEQALRESEERYRLLAENASDVIWTMDKDLHYTYVSPSITRLTGYSIDEAMAQSLEEGLAPGSFEAAMQVLEEEPPGQSLGQEGSQASWVLEMEANRKDGSTVWFEANVNPLLDSQGQIIGYVGVSRNIMDRKRAERELSRTMAELERSNAELEQFAYVASHDLQEPLRMVSSYVQLLARRYQDKIDDDANEFIGFATDGAERMQKLINDLLSYSRVTTQGKPFEPTDCEAVISNALDNLAVAIEESSAKVTHDNLPTVMADESQLLRLFQNLVGNAIKFQGDDPPRVHVSAEPRDNEWVISVHDDGIGIAPEFFERIFQIFQRLHGRGKYPGTGIGLAVCRKIVERHGGRIWVESETEKGATFYFTLPMEGRGTQ